MPHVLSRFVLVSTLAASLAANVAFAAQPPPADAAADDDPERLISLDFPGGSVADYIGAVRRALPDVNVVLHPRVEEFQVTPVQLRNVHERAAVTMLQNAAVHPRGEGRLAVRVIEGPAVAWRRVPGRIERVPAGNTVYILETDLKLSETTPTGSPRHSLVLAVADVVGEHITAADMLAAIETALELRDDDEPPVQIRFHEATSMLIARGTRSQVQQVEIVIDQLRIVAAQRRDAADLVPRLEVAQLERTLAQRVSEISRLEREIGILRRELEAARLSR
jgi:hypothetical protein